MHRTYLSRSTVLAVLVAVGCGKGAASDNATAELLGSTSSPLAGTCYDEAYQPETVVTHPNGGGFKSTRAQVDASAFIGPQATVCNQAKVLGNARIEDSARVDGNSTIRDNAVVAGKGWVGGGVDSTGNHLIFASAVISGAATVRGHVTGSATVSDSAQVLEGALVSGASLVDGNALVAAGHVYGSAHVGGTAQITGQYAHVLGNALVTDSSTVSDSAVVRDLAQIKGHSTVSGYARIRDQAVVTDSTLSGNALVQGDVQVQGEQCGTGCVRDTAYDQVIYFGRLEAQNGALKTASGVLPKPGDQVNLKLFLPELASFVCREYCFAIQAHLFVRFDGASPFQEVPRVPTAQYVMRGPQVAWDRDGVGDMALKVPSQADRIEAYIRFERITYNGSACYMAYDMAECPATSPLADEYLSNGGRNFRIEVR